MTDQLNIAATEKTVATLILGMIEAIRTGAIELWDAETLIFSPAAMQTLELLGASEDLIDLVHLGTELEDLEGYGPSVFEECLDEITLGATSFLKTKDKLTLDHSMWLMRKLLKDGERS